MVINGDWLILLYHYATADVQKARHATRTPQHAAIIALMDALATVLVSVEDGWYWLATRLALGYASVKVVGARYNTALYCIVTTSIATVIVAITHICWWRRRGQRNVVMSHVTVIAIANGSGIVCYGRRRASFTVLGAPGHYVECWRNYGYWLMLSRLRALSRYDASQHYIGTTTIVIGVTER